MKLHSIVLAASIAITGCEGGDPTGATCPTDSTLTYANFGADFMGSYCTTCHSADATDRHGAPGGVNFDTQDEVVRHKAAIDSAAGKGPDASNDWMPDEDSLMFPTDAEREQLAEWLACGAP